LVRERGIKGVRVWEELGEALVEMERKVSTKPW
jgi:hypothetical protein